MPLRARPERRPYRGRVARAGGQARLSDEWRAWLAENVLLGVPRRELLETLGAQGVPAAIASREIDELVRSPLLLAANKVARLVRRHELIVRMKRAVDRLAASPRDVERRSRVSSDEFFDRYYAANVPLVLTDALDAWPAARRWSPADWKTRFGGALVEVTTDREAGPIFEPNFKAHCRTMPMSELCDRVVAAGTTNDVYLIANNHLAQRPGLEALLEDIRGPHECLDDQRTGEVVSIWFGPAGTLTPLHHDTSNVLFLQVYGKKRFLLFPAWELFLTHDPHHGVHSPIDAERPDLDLHPDFAHASRREVELSPGEGLFVPIGWWHHVRALEVSISMSLTNFRRNNHFPWYYPGLVK
jgi:hypothetical protein